MLIIPAIDLMDGKVVRLKRGLVNECAVYSNDPVSVALHFEECGVRRIHVVDLDAAFGKSSNRAVVRSICKSISCEVEVGGGVRGGRDIEELLDAGASKVIVGTLAVKHRKDFETVFDEFGGYIIVGADVREGVVRVSGWVERSSVSYVDFLKYIDSLGVFEAIVTNIDRDGTLDGVDISFYKEIVEKVKMGIIASGGVKDETDIGKLVEIGKLRGVVLGKAVYEGSINLREVVMKYG